MKYILYLYFLTIALTNVSASSLRKEVTDDILPFEYLNISFVPTLPPVLNGYNFTVPDIPSIPSISSIPSVFQAINISIPDIPDIPSIPEVPLIPPIPPIPPITNQTINLTIPETASINIRFPNLTLSCWHPRVVDNVIVCNQTKI